MSSRHTVARVWSQGADPSTEVLADAPEHCGARMATDRARAEFFCEACGEVQDARYAVSAAGGDDPGIYRRTVRTGKPPIRRHSQALRDRALKLWRGGLRAREVAEALGLDPRTVMRWIAGSRCHREPRSRSYGSKQGTYR